MFLPEVFELIQVSLENRCLFVVLNPFGDSNGSLLHCHPFFWYSTKAEFSFDPVNFRVLK